MEKSKSKCSMTQEEIDGEGLRNVVHLRRNVRGPRPGLSCKAISAGTEGRNIEECWVAPSRRPDVMQRRRMIGFMMETAIKLVMTNHYYSFENVIRKQGKGGAIGNSLTERLGKLMGKRFSRKFKTLLEKLQIKTELNKNYVGDFVAALTPLDPGVRFCGERMEMVKNGEMVESDKRDSNDKRTLEELKKIGNSVYESMQFTTDFPSSCEEGKVPVLDVQMYVGENGQIRYEFYEKPCQSKFVIPNGSAHSKQGKLSVLVEEGLRRLRNCSKEVEEGVRVEIMTKWANKLRRSGYPPTVRHQVIKESIFKYERMCVDERDGGRPIHRARDWQRDERRLAKEKKLAGSWHKGGGLKVSAPLIMDPVAGYLEKVVKAACRDFERTTDIRVMVKMRAGNSVRTDAKSEPLRVKDCGREECLCCSTENPGGCETNSCSYRIICVGCERNQETAHYDGETGRIRSPEDWSTKET